MRMNMIGDTCTGIIHKKPKAGGISAVGGTGSVYTFYTPDAPEFKQLSEVWVKWFGHAPIVLVNWKVRIALACVGGHKRYWFKQHAALPWKDFLKTSIPTLMQSLDLPNEPLPLWWTGDFINADPGAPGTPCTIDKWIVGEFNCSCVGISKCLPAYCKADTPNASFFDIPVADLVEAGPKARHGRNMSRSKKEPPV